MLPLLSFVSWANPLSFLKLHFLIYKRDVDASFLGVCEDLM